MERKKEGERQGESEREGGRRKERWANYHYFEFLETRMLKVIQRDQEIIYTLSFHFGCTNLIL